MENRFAWNANLFYSVHDFFGVDTSIVSWNQPYAVDLTGQVRFAVYRYKSVVAVLNGNTGAYFTRTNTTLWNQQLGVELLATQGVFGLGLFVNWIVVDQLPPRQKRTNWYWWESTVLIDPVRNNGLNYFYFYP